MKRGRHYTAEARALDFLVWVLWSLLPAVEVTGDLDTEDRCAEEEGGRSQLLWIDYNY
jgi:hypothetical protein